MNTTLWQGLVRTEDRAVLRLRYLIYCGGIRRYGPDWQKVPERTERINYELSVIEKAGFSASFVMLSMILDFCRREEIPYGPGRGSVGGCYVGYLAGIHEVDSLRWGLDFERFLNPDRVSYPDVDIDISQRHRDRVLEYIAEEFGRGNNAVLQIVAFARMGARSLIDNMFSALQHQDPNAGATAENLRRCLPDGPNITGGTKQVRELAWWLDNGVGDKRRFVEIASQAGWLDTMLKLDSLQQHLGKHAAGVVILNKEDLRYIPQAGARNARGEWHALTGYDMYALDSLDYLKWDILGLRSLDLVVDASKLAGEPGTIDHCFEVWHANMDRPEVYEVLKDADTTGVFQMETPGYRRTLRAFEPSEFEHIVQLNALYRPGALDFRREDGKNMVEVFIERKRGREPVVYDHPLLEPILRPTYGIILYQEQAMRIARDLGGFTGAQADSLRKAIGKKRRKEMDKLMPLLKAGMTARGVAEAIGDRIVHNIEAAARYSWNKAHSVEYAIITWMTAWYKATQPAAFFAALINSWADKKERQSAVLSEARQEVTIKPPDVNLAEADFVVADGDLVFGLNGLKGMGEAYRDMILINRAINGPFNNYEDLCRRLPSLPINLKLALVRCGAFDTTDDRALLLAEIPKHRSDKVWTAAEHINHSCRLKRPRPLPPLWEMNMPTTQALARGEMDVMGFYISTTPLAEVAKALARMPKANHFGGEIETIRIKRDRRGDEMAMFTMLTPALTRQRVTVFSSIWDRYRDEIERGAQVIVRGRMDGTLLCDAVFAPDDVRHFARAKISRGEENSVEVLTNGMSQIEMYEEAGYKVKLL